MSSILFPVLIHRQAICEFVPIRAGQVSFFIPFLAARHKHSLCRILPPLLLKIYFNSKFLFFAQLPYSNDGTLLKTSQFV